MAERRGKMYLPDTLLTTVIVLIGINIILIGALWKINLKAERQMKSLMEKWKAQNLYMDYTVEFCHETKSLIGEVRDSIRNSRPEEGNRCVEKCGQLLKRSRGGSTVLEALLIHKEQICRRKNIEFADRISFLPGAENMRATDAVSVMGNLLDNAIEAASVSSDGRRVEVISEKRKNVWFLKVVNSKNPSGGKTEGKAADAGKDRADHGMGMEIVRAAVDRYSGTVKFQDSGDTFTVNVAVFMKNAA